MAPTSLVHSSPAKHAACAGMLTEPIFDASQTYKVSVPMMDDPSNSRPSEAGSPSQSGFTVVCLGVGGGPLEHDCSCYIMKPSHKTWNDGALLLEGGSWLGSLVTLFEQPEKAAAVFHDAQLPEGLSPEGCAELFNTWVSQVYITHGHLDHIFGLVLASASLRAQRPVYGLLDTLDTIQGLFNGRLWPRLASFDEKDPMAFYHLRPLEIETPHVVDEDVTVVPFPICHGPTCLLDGVANFRNVLEQSPHCRVLNDVLPTVSTAFLFTNQKTQRDMLFIGDVEPDDIGSTRSNYTLWKQVALRVAQKRLRAIFLECSFSSEHPDHLLFGHLTPLYLYQELRRLAELVCKERGLSASKEHLKGSLQGLRCIIMHVKSLVVPCQQNKCKCSIDTCTPSTVPSKEPLPLPQMIEHELAELEATHQLGIQFIMARKGQRIGTFFRTLH